MQYILLGIIQGLTEFLPVSSSGHLVIFQTLLRIQENIALDTVLHLATALALIIYFWRDIIDLLVNNRKMLWLLLVGTIITGIIGIAFKDFFEGLFSSVQAVGGFLILTGVVILLGEWWGKGKRKIEDMNIWDAVLVGLAQGAAIAPGLSRSGTTISASLARNLDRTLAARFSFLLAIPAILGAGLLQSKAIIKAGTLGIGPWPLILGFLAAFISGLIAIRFFMSLIQRTSIRMFAYYCFTIG
ncbi:MAG: undecaprenyl-diphosphate phosphatase, partial [Candidatus Margulisbacteria bacterium]|nr:undecaprenyl-diphosphate phosphatase [Candidatus Margulisiibacteriota bacterium]